MSGFGKHVRRRREELQSRDRNFSLRKVAARAGLEPAYLSKIERGEFPPPGEESIRKLAAELGDDPDVMLALAGKVSGDLLEIIRRRPRLFADLIRSLRELPDNAVLKIVREVQDGEW